MNGKKAAMAIREERRESVTAMDLISEGWRYNATEKTIRIISCTAKNAKTPAAALFHWAASASLPLTISEKE